MKNRRAFLRDAVAATAGAAVGVPSAAARALTPVPGAPPDQPPFPPPRTAKGLRLKVSPNGRYFIDQDNKPFFYLGDTVWLIFQRLNKEELEEYLKDRAAKG